MERREDTASLRRTAVRGSFFLTLRQGTALVLGTIGLLYMTRLVGPAGYGLYIAAFGVMRYLTLIGEGGVKMYLLRAPRETPMMLFHQAFWWLLMVSVVGTPLILGALYVAGHFWVRTEGFIPIAAVLCASVPLVLITYVPMALAERSLLYQRVAGVEIASQVLYYGTGILTARWGWGAWAFVSAFWAGQLTLLVGYFVATRYRPRWHWNRLLVKELLQESLKMGTAAWIYELRLLAPSMILMPLTNEIITGYYGLAYRLMSTLGFVRSAIARLSVPIYSKVQSDPQRVLEATRLSGTAQMLGLAAFYLPFVALGGVILPLVFGSKWDTRAVLLTFALISANQFFFVIFGALNQALLVARQAHALMKAGTLYIALGFPLAAALTWSVPEPYKLYGFTLALTLAYVPSYYWMMHVYTGRYLAQPHYGVNLIWAMGLSAMIFAPFTSGWSLLGAVVFLHPASRRAVREILNLIHESRATRRNVDPAE